MLSLSLSLDWYNQDVLIDRLCLYTEFLTPIEMGDIIYLLIGLPSCKL